ncbi:hypothetical protein PsYK624_155330 [Phanerochaete sordida]|uniref:Uncharacterized protein n=1 Tax=Phanerochaete sordida TaxID=48140 RepID=A0A9P3LLD2_9APHY|nr:hypothetical protein PsYK624_155330 [Phanerochaete sordida]
MGALVSLFRRCPGQPSRDIFGLGPFSFSPNLSLLPPRCPYSQGRGGALGKCGQRARAAVVVATLVSNIWALAHRASPSFPHGFWGLMSGGDTDFWVKVFKHGLADGQSALYYLRMGFACAADGRLPYT